MIKVLTGPAVKLDNIYNAEDYYVDFFDENKGVIVCGYARTDNEKESYRIYQTANGGETWTTVGAVLLIIY